MTGAGRARAPLSKKQDKLPVDLHDELVLEPASAAAGWIGFDLAWSARNRSGACALLEDGADGVRVAALAHLATLGELEQFALRHAAPSCVVGVDAPLVVANEEGSRACDRLLTAVFGRQGGGAYPANRRLLSKDGAPPRGEELLQRLARRGFESPPRLDSRAARQVHEVHPHGAWLRLFRLERRLGYKEKTRDLALHLAERARALELLGNLREPRLAAWERVRPLLEAEGRPAKERKRREDLLDAIVCALVAWWRSRGLCEALGDEQGGFALAPARAARVKKN
jgi:predicted RNase H-like nuclease